MGCKDCTDDCRQGRDCPNAVTYNLWPGVIKWVIGMFSIALFPFILVIGAAFCVVYYIPISVGGWIYDFCLKIIKNEKDN